MGEEGTRDRARQKQTRKTSGTCFWDKSAGFWQDRSDKWERIGARGGDTSSKFPARANSRGAGGGDWGVSVLWGAPGALSGRGTPKEDPNLSPRSRHTRELTVRHHAGRWPRSPASPQRPQTSPAPPLAKGDPGFPVPHFLGDAGSRGCAGGGWRVAPSEAKLAPQLLPPPNTEGFYSQRPAAGWGLTLRLRASCRCMSAACSHCSPGTIPVSTVPVCTILVWSWSMAAQRWPRAVAVLVPPELPRGACAGGGARLDWQLLCSPTPGLQEALGL